MIEQFVAQSIGEWRSMRSGHSLAFRQFEEVISIIKIKPININESIIKESIHKSEFPKAIAVSPFSIEWYAESDWVANKQNEEMKGNSILIPINISNNKGLMLRSLGYAEKINAVSEYSFLSDKTLTLNTSYDQTLAQERIWFLSKNVRCRSSVIRAKVSNAILQTSFASEIRIREEISN